MITITFCQRELIAQRPLERREDFSDDGFASRRAENRASAIPRAKDLLKPGDVLVLNDTRVLAARRFSDDGTVEFLFLERIGSKRWKCMVNPGRKMRVGAMATIDDACLRVEEITTAGERIVSFDQDVDVYGGGSMPLPPYVNRPSDETDTARYQTVFAREPGAVAAPTAGLHFTSEILSEIPHTFVTLHVGPGTFLPVRSEDIAEHRMHAERFSISPQAADSINNAQRVVAVGTTVVRVLETAALQTRLVGKIVGQAHRSPSAGGAPALQEPEPSHLESQSGETDLFIYPSFRFRVVEALLTNFHLPRSTLLMLVSAFAGREFILGAYEEAVRDRYRFYSYGDCMLIL